MPQLNENAFTFTSQALPEDTFSVVRVEGEEGLSQLYRFEVTLISKQAEIDLTAVTQSPATFTIKGALSGGEDLPFHGILASFEQLQRIDGYYVYRAELRPRLWWLTLTYHNQVFLEQSDTEIIAAALKDGGLSPGLDFELRCQQRFPTRDYVCQYGETHFDFISRWMERDGLYYWFEQGGTTEKLIISDTQISHTPWPGHERLRYSETSGLDQSQAGSVVQHFGARQRPLPRQILLRDYNYEKPDLTLEGKAEVIAQGYGQTYLYGLYGEHFQEPSEGARLAKIRAEELRRGQLVFHGRSQVPTLRPGYTFDLASHFRDDFNQTYLTTSIHHQGSQARYLLQGLGLRADDEPDALFYRNTFDCIPAATQFRAERQTRRARIDGMLSAKIDAPTSGGCRSPAIPGGS